MSSVSPSRPSTKNYRNSKQIAAEFGVSPKTVRRWTAAGLIPGQRIGPRLIRYDLDEVRAALLGNAL